MSMKLKVFKDSKHIWLFRSPDIIANVDCVMSALGVRQFFHRMVVCLEEAILPFVPIMVNLMLVTPDAKELYDFIPMLNQLITKFKVCT